MHGRDPSGGDFDHSVLKRRFPDGKHPPRAHRDRPVGLGTLREG